MKKTSTMAIVGGLLACTAFSSAAHAELAPPLRAMLDAAIASGNDADIDTVAKYLKKTSPDDGAAIDRTIADHRAQIAAAHQDKLRHQTFLEGWKGEGQIGASQTSGNSDTVGVSVGLSLTKESLHWRYNLRALADYQRTNGFTSQNQLLAAFEPNYKFNDRLFAFGLAQYERNRFAGFSDRDTLGGGLGYRVVASPSFTIDVKGGPAWQHTAFIGVPHSSELTALGELDAAWKISPAVSFSENAKFLYGSSNTSMSSLTALTAKLGRALSGRVSYQVTDNSNPPPGFKNVDTLTRLTLVYGF